MNDSYDRVIARKLDCTLFRRVPGMNETERRSTLYTAIPFLDHELLIQAPPTS